MFPLPATISLRAESALRGLALTKKSTLSFQYGGINQAVIDGFRKR
jgi:hypothetical protein